MFIRDKLVLILLFELLLMSCKTNNYNEVERQYKQENVDLLPLKNSLLINATDTIKNWVSDSLVDVSDISDCNWALDSFVVINEKRNRAIGLILKSYTGTLFNYRTDDISYLLCEKRQGKWYFFLGATMVLPREITTGNITKPATINQLAIIGRKNLLLSTYYRPLPWIKRLKVNEQIFEYGYMGNYGTEQQKLDWIGRIGRH